MTDLRETAKHVEPVEVIREKSPYALPRVTIKFCTQCKWMLRAAYYAQELLSTFSTSLGEVSLIPSVGGTFIVEIFFPTPTPIPIPNPNLASSSFPPSSSSSDLPGIITSKLLWDRKTDGGFPETKELKRRVRDVIDPGRNLGHVDRDHPKPTTSGGGSDEKKKKENDDAPEAKKRKVEGEGEEGEGKEKTKGAEAATEKEEAAREGASQAKEDCEDCK